MTVDEETGMTGAFNLDKNMITGKILLNLDSEDDAEIFVGCAGGIDTVCTFHYNRSVAPADYHYFKVEVSGALADIRVVTFILVMPTPIRCLHASYGILERHMRLRLPKLTEAISATPYRVPLMLLSVCTHRTRRMCA